MKTNRISIMAAMAALSLTSCQKEQSGEPNNSAQTAISLSAAVETIGAFGAPTANARASAIRMPGTRASGTTFPNTGKISVIADYWPEDWTGLYFNDMEATTVDISPTTYGFTWNSGSEQYWPLNGSKLALLAYSPKNAAIVASGKMLTVTLPAVSSNMPDLLYCDGVKYGDKSLSGRNINFGLFRHALSQLTVKLVTVTVGPPIVLSEFSVTTKNSATFDLLSQTLVVSPSTTVKYSYASQPILANNTTYTLQSSTGNPLLVYPDVAGLNNTTVYVKFTDGSGTGNALDFEKTLNISDFKLADNATSAKLERAKQSVLTITVKGTQILGIELDGVIVDWVNMGEFGLTIE